MSIEGTGRFEGLEWEAPIKPNLLALEYLTTEADGDNTFKKTKFFNDRFFYGTAVLFLLLICNNFRKRSITKHTVFGSFDFKSLSTAGTCQLHKVKS